MSERPDHRENDQLRPVQLIRKFTDNAPGSVLACFGQTRVLVTATLEERVPRHVLQRGEGHGWLTAEYSLLPGSTHVRTQRERLKVSGRTYEIQRLIGRALRASVDLSKLGQRTLTIDADVLQADGGTRVAAITGAYVAMVDALNSLPPETYPNGLPLLSPLAAVSVGIVHGEVRLDLNYDEDSAAEVDANVVMNAAGEFIEVQASSESKPFGREALDAMLAVADKGLRELLALQQQALASS
jgi:ribonuclease PH